jgi:DNA mismatch repair ATPase MutS
MSLAKVNDSLKIKVFKLKGTSSSDGVGLFAASVAALCEKKTRLLAATHFHEVFSFPEFLEIDGLAFYTLETMMTPGECPEFLYHLIPGRSISSMGILCAENNGIKETVLARARMIAEALERGEPIPILKPRKDMEDKAFAVVTYFLKLDLSRQDSSLDIDHFFKLLSSFEKTL